MVKIVKSEIKPTEPELETSKAFSVLCNSFHSSPFTLHSSRTSRRAFSMIELLVVISIIGILSGMVAGSVMLIRDTAKKRQARVEAVAIVTALKKYRGDFFQWPNQTKSNSNKDGIFDSETEIAAILKPLMENAKMVNYIEIPEASYQNGTYVDPWGEPYVIAIDYSSDSVTKLELGEYKTNILDTAVALSIGRDPEKPEEGITSW